MNTVTKLHLENTGHGRREAICILSLCKELLKLSQVSHKALCVWSKDGDRKPYLSCDTIQRQLHMCVWCCLLYGLAWHAYRVASLECDSCKTIEIHALPYPGTQAPNIQLGDWSMTGHTIQVHSHCKSQIPEL